MAASTRWMVTDPPDAPARGVACRILRDRLDAVWKLLSAASDDRHHRADHVHQLRVATRRSLVVMSLFEDLLDRRERDWFERQLVRIRRTAGEARDLDVLTERLRRDIEAMDESHSAGGRKSGRGSSPERKRMRRLLSMLGRQRDNSRQPVRELHRRLADADWPARVERLLRPLESGPGRTFAKHARRRIKVAMKAFFRHADRRQRDSEELHRLRIEGKKLRYALEVCGVAFQGRQRAKCLEAVEGLQERLGDFTDHAAAADRFGRWRRQKAARACRAELSELHRHESKCADEARRAFAEWWTPRRRKQLRRRFERSLRGG